MRSGSEVVFRLCMGMLEMQSTVLLCIAMRRTP